MRAVSLRWLALVVLAGCEPPPPDVTVAPFPDCVALRQHMVQMGRKEVSDPWLGLLFPDTTDRATDPWGATTWRTRPSDSADPFERSAASEATLVTLAGHAVVLIDLTLAEGPAQAAAVPIDGRPRGLLLRDSVVWVLSDLGQDRPAPRADSDVSTWRTDGGTLLTAIDIREPSAPRLLRELYLTGRARVARREGSVLSLTHTEHVRLARGTDGEREARIRVDEAAATTWLPQQLDHRRNTDGSWDVTRASTCDCTDTWSARHETGPVVTGLTHIDLDDPLAPVRGAALIGRADVVHLARQSLAVAWSPWTGGPWHPPLDGHTVVTALDLDADGRPVASSSGLHLGRLPSVPTLRDAERIVSVPLITETGAEIRALGRSGTGLLDVTEPLPLPELPREVRYTSAVGLVEPIDADAAWASLDLGDQDRPRLLGTVEPGIRVSHAIADGEGRYLGLAANSDDRFLWTLNATSMVSNLEPLDLPPDGLTPRLGRVDERAWVAGLDGDRTAVELEQGINLVQLALPTTWTDEVPEACTSVQSALAIGDQSWFISNVGALAVRAPRLDLPSAAVRFEGIDPCADRFDTLF